MKEGMLDKIGETRVVEGGGDALGETELLG
jgi:hypothetical protein